MAESARPSVAIACQGGGAHAAFTAGVLMELLQPRHAGRFELAALSGTSGGAVCASLAWSGLLRRSGGGPTKAIEVLGGFWQDLSARDWWDEALNAWAVSTLRLPLVWEVSPYTTLPWAEQRMRALLETYVALDQLPARPEDRRRPALFVGATDIRHGGGIAFKGEELTYDDIIASAAVPPLFRAVHAHGTLYWDGLFSRNPPIREFTDLEQKPDEIWVVRINPKGRASEPETMPEIADRRNELAGNLALDQELYFIEKINELRTHSDKLQERYQPITIREIALSLDLDYPSKFDRTPAFIEHLIENGRRQASLLLERPPGGKRTTTPFRDRPGRQSELPKLASVS